MAHHTVDEEALSVRITAVIEREFERRGVFPEFRLRHAYRIINGATGEYTITCAKARELAQDAEKMRQRSAELPKGIPKAYTSLHDQILTAIRAFERRGLWDDPGRQEVERRIGGACARFEPGEKALVKFFDDYAWEPCTVVAPFGLQCVHSEQGPYVTRDDKRVDYRYGYVVQTKDGREFFTAPHRLRHPEDEGPSYLCLASSKAQQSPMPRQPNPQPGGSWL